MCFTIPTKVLRVHKKTALVEGNRTVKLGNDIQVKKGEYIQIVGNVAVGKISPKKGLEIRQLIKSLNVYEQ